MKRFTIIDVGCFECGVSTIVQGSYDTLDEAKAVNDPNRGWRDGGQSAFMIVDNKALTIVE